MKLLVVVDLSEASRRVLDEAEKIATASKADVWLLHVAQPEPDFVGWDIEPDPGRRAVAETFRDEHRQVQRMADSLRDSGLNVTALLVQGSTVDKILEQASELDVDAILMGSHGRSAAFRLLVGSVSEGVLHKATRPVIVVPTRA